jgi:hypothetical protein
MRGTGRVELSEFGNAGTLYEMGPRVLLNSVGKDD